MVMTNPAVAASQADPHTTAGKLADLERRRSEAVHAGSQQAVAKQHERGKRTARERIDMLLDPGSFTETDELARHRGTDFGIAASRPYGDGVVTGYGTVDGRPVRRRHGRPAGRHGNRARQRRGRALEHRHHTPPRRRALVPGWAY